ncbi:MAG: DUF6127 family protein [Novosphingopyxis baekryungensis]|jgi:hypothetical protein|uniref:DUF6127 family protein n=1 Tax=Novosphingopyxis baekryungensis TaxID=279369 RepID=UPI0003B3E6ED|nr:DUF6127 family protein [Novosphingopyxis baekryungensis]MDE0933863.1 DUF6127 family protein [Novosphingopyxis baekryungensis]
MKTADMLAGLAAEARREGIDVTTLRAIIEEASDAGAARALERLGLSDGAAHGDVKELRQLLAAWREAKRGALKAALDWLIKGLCALLLIGIAVRLGAGELMR